METGAFQQWRTLWAYKWWLLAFVVAAAAATYVVSKRESPTYSAHAVVQISPGAQTQGNLLTNDQIQSVINTYLQTAKTSPVYNAAAKKLKMSGSDVAADTDVQAEQNVTLLEFYGASGDPAQAARIGNAYANAFTSYVTKLGDSNVASRIGPIQRALAALEAQRAKLPAGDPGIQVLDAQIAGEGQALAAAQTTSNDIARILQPADPPDAPSSPKPTRNALLALVAALIIGVAALTGYVLIADRYRSPEEAAADIGLPILGEIPRAPADDQTSIEAFRRLRTAVLFGLGQPAAGGDPSHQGRGVAVLVAADERGVGKTHTTVNLGRSLATDGWRVAVVDGDLRRPTVHEQFGLRPTPGLAELLTDRTVHLAGMVGQDVPLLASGSGAGGELKAVVGGTPVHDSTERLSSRYMADVIEGLKDEFEFVVLDSAPLALVVDAVVLSRYSQGVVLVVDARRSKRRDVRRAVAALRAAEAPILGVVFNRSGAGASLYGYEGGTRPTADAATEVVR